VTTFRDRAFDRPVDITVSNPRAGEVVSEVFEGQEARPRVDRGELTWVASAYAYRWLFGESIGLVLHHARWFAPVPTGTRTTAGVRSGVGASLRCIQFCDSGTSRLRERGPHARKTALSRSSRMSASRARQAPGTESTAN